MDKYNIIKLSDVSSTNNYVLSLKADKMFKEGLVIVSDYQTKGKGQRENDWESEKGKNLIISVVIEPNISIEKQFDISKIASFSVVDCLLSLGLKSKIKWPNDILISKQKIAGILIQNKLQGSLIVYSIIGIGLNINQINFKEYSPKATSLQLLLNKKFDIDKIQMQLLYSLSDRIAKYRKGTPQEEEYLKMLYLKDKVAAYETKGEKFMGIIKEVSKNGRLLIQLENDKIAEFENQTIKYLF